MPHPFTFSGPSSLHAGPAFGPAAAPTLAQLRGHRYFDGEAGAGGGGDAGAAAGAAGAGAGSTGNTGGQQGTGETLTPDDARALRQQADRRMSERNAARDALKPWQELGITPEEAKALKDARDAAAGGPTPDQIRLQARQEAEREATERYAARARQSAVREQATALGFHNPKAALAMLNADELAKVEVHDDEADEGAVKSLLEKLAAAEPYLVREKGPQTPSYRAAGIGAGGGSVRADVAPGTPRMEAAYATSSPSTR